MKKLFVLLIAVLVSFSLFAASEEAQGDVSGNDLNPVLRGLHLQFAGGILAYVGKAGGDNAGSPIGSTLKLKECSSFDELAQLVTPLIKNESQNNYNVI